MTVVWGNVTELVRTQGAVGMANISLFPLPSPASSASFVSSTAVAGAVITFVLAGISFRVESLDFPIGGLTNL